MRAAPARTRVILAPSFLVALALAPLSCRTPRPTSPLRASCASLDTSECDRAQALTRVASGYADEAHDYVLAAPEVPPSTALARTGEGWRPLSLACVRSRRSARQLDTSVVDYGFVGVVLDATLLSADADIGSLLARTRARTGRDAHEVKLVALAFVRDLAPATFGPGPSLVETARGDCRCGDATHFAGATKYGAMLSYGFETTRHDSHVRALDFVRDALGDHRVAVHESHLGTMTIDGLERLLSRDTPVPLTFHVTDAQPIAYAASPLGELCDFAAPEVSPSPLDFGVAPYGTEARRALHVVNRSAIDLRALVGASTFVLPARGTIDLPLRWTPDGDAPGCETQTRDEAIPFLRLRSGNGSTATARTARVLETIRTGRPSLTRTERVELSPPAVDLASTVRDWTCPHDFVRRSCRAENASPAGSAVAEERGEQACHFACRGPLSVARPPSCRFDAVMDCALQCAP